MFSSKGVLCRALLVRGQCKVVQGSVRRVGWFAASQYSNAHGHLVPVAVGLQDSARHTKADLANNAAVRIQQALRVRVDIRRVREWVEA